MLASDAVWAGNHGKGRSKKKEFKVSGTLSPLSKHLGTERGLLFAEPDGRYAVFFFPFPVVAELLSTGGELKKPSPGLQI